MFEGFDEVELTVNGTTAFGRRAGSGPAVLLLHGFPETSAMWHRVAAVLAERFSVVCLDLRGYGRSGCPPSTDDHFPYSKRALAADVVAAMAALGHERFAVAGHDRGGRVAYRAALDHPAAIERLALLDIVPIDAAWRHADDRLALGFWPWSLLAQEAPLPERLVGAAPQAVIDQALSAEWGTPGDVFDPAARAEYLTQLQDAEHVHAICEEYRAASSIDREHDRADVDTGQTITGPVRVLWSSGGPLGTWYDELGGPLALWRDLAPQVDGAGVDGGHFFPEEHPAETAQALATFFESER